MPEPVDSSDPRFVYKANFALGPEAAEKAREAGRLREFVCGEMRVWLERMLLQIHFDNKDYGQDFTFEVSAIPKVLANDN